jgi:hypothetical protein
VRKKTPKKAIKKEILLTFFIIRIFIFDLKIDLY